ncbi:Cysteine desulfurase mitochondrial [Stylosanthes scabra]|uniref:Cysteine desulfurase mitochondrial n=1 Tax=Stylosanthes scabra TaxID=79078 RepID=A0ABU6UFT2_9FABA|nr:Cysteine desulfurase mitochondrial [Stylosanthes scabra]
MEARFGTEALQFYAMGGSSVGKRSMEWDLNDWKWDGDLFIGRPLNPGPEHRQFFPAGTGIPLSGGPSNSNSSSSCSDEVDLRIREGNKEGDKKRRVVVLEDML